MRIVSLIVSFLLVVIAVAFVLLNRTAVALNYLVGSGQYPLAVVIMLAFGLGILVTLLLVAAPLLKTKYSVRTLKKRVNKLEQELLDYRDQVTKDV